MARRDYYERNKRFEFELISMKRRGKGDYNDKIRL